jgi:hypothetical protein
MINYSNIFVNEGISYYTYRNLINLLLDSGKTTGNDHSKAMLDYTKLNIQRMNRVEKTAVLSENLVKAIDSIKKHYCFLVISEGWCGDAAQVLPVFQKIVERVPEKLELRLVLRDTNLPLIDAHLTNGGRSIPKLLVLDDAGNLVAEWGPRVKELQTLLFEWKKEIPDAFEVAQKLHYWYAKDKTHTTQEELVRVMEKLQ